MSKRSKGPKDPISAAIDAAVDRKVDQRMLTVERKLKALTGKLNVLHDMERRINALPDEIKAIMHDILFGNPPDASQHQTIGPSATYRSPPNALRTDGAVAAPMQLEQQQANGQSSDGDKNLELASVLCGVSGKQTKKLLIMLSSGHTEFTPQIFGNVKSGSNNIRFTAAALSNIRAISEEAGGNGGRNGKRYAITEKGIIISKALSTMDTFIGSGSVTAAMPTPVVKEMVLRSLVGTSKITYAEARARSGFDYTIELRAIRQLVRDGFVTANISDLSKLSRQYRSTVALTEKGLSMLRDLDESRRAVIAAMSDVQMDAAHAKVLEVIESGGRLFLKQIMAKTGYHQRQASGALTLLALTGALRFRSGVRKRSNYEITDAGRSILKKLRLQLDAAHGPTGADVPVGTKRTGAMGTPSDDSDITETASSRSDSALLGIVFGDGRPNGHSNANAHINYKLRPPYGKHGIDMSVTAKGVLGSLSLPEQRILLAMGTSSVTKKELAGLTGFNERSLFSLIHYLRDKGLIESVRIEGRKTYEYSLTDSGRQISSLLRTAKSDPAIVAVEKAGSKVLGGEQVLRALSNSTEITTGQVAATFKVSKELASQILSRLVEAGFADVVATVDNCPSLYKIRPEGTAALASVDKFVERLHTPIAPSTRLKKNEEDMLRYIVEHGHATTQAASELLNVHPTRAVRVLSNLAASELVTRSFGGQKNHYIWTATPKGMTALNIIDTKADLAESPDTHQKTVPVATTGGQVGATAGQDQSVNGESPGHSTAQTGTKATEAAPTGQPPHATDTGTERITVSLTAVLSPEDPMYYTILKLSQLKDPERRILQIMEAKGDLDMAGIAAELSRENMLPRDETDAEAALKDHILALSGKYFISSYDLTQDIRTTPFRLTRDGRNALEILRNSKSVGHLSRGAKAETGAARLPTKNMS